MVMGRPKLEIARTEDIHLRVTKFEAEKISKIAKEKNLTKTDAILQAIDLFATYKPKIYRPLKKNVKKISSANLNDDDFDNF